MCARGLGEPCSIALLWVLAAGRDAQDQTSAYPADASGGKEEGAAVRSKQEEALLRRARKLVDLGDRLKSIREELEHVAFDIYDEVGEAVTEKATMGRWCDRGLTLIAYAVLGGSHPLGRSSTGGAQVAQLALSEVEVEG